MGYTVSIGIMKKCLNSTKQTFTEKYTKTTVTLKEGSGLVNPVFEFTGGTAAVLDLCNYLVITWGSMGNTPVTSYYYIDEKTYMYNSYFELRCTRDPMATFKDDIGDYEGFITRCNNDQLYNVYDNDDILPPTNKKSSASSIQIDTTDFSYFERSAPFGPTSGVITLYGSKGVYHVLDYGVGIASRLEDFMQPSNLWDVAKYGFTQPGNFIKSCIILPFTAHGTAATKTIAVGNEVMSYYSLYIEDNKRIFSKQGGKSITGSGGILEAITAFNNHGMEDYRRYNDNYLSLSVKLPFAGIIKIPSDVLSYDYLGFKYEVDIITGSGEVLLFASDSGQTVERLLYKGTVQMGAELPIAANTNNIVALAQNVISGNVMGAMNNMLNPFDNTYVGNTDGVGYYDIGSVDLLVNIRECDDIKDYRTMKGVPTNKKKKINEVYTGTTSSNGYLEVGFPACAPTGATASEISTINGYLGSGFYYE